MQDKTILVKQPEIKYQKQSLTKKVCRVMLYNCYFRIRGKSDYF